MMIALTPLGDRGFLAQFASEADAAAWARTICISSLPGVVDVVTAYRDVAVFSDPDRIEMPTLESTLANIVSQPSTAVSIGRLIRIPVLYIGDDLSDVATQTGRSTDEVIRLHAAPAYRVLAVGFLPGFPYLGNLNREIAGLPRRDSPRTRVPAGSVAIAGLQTGIYPRESPGGWHLLGRTPLVIANAATGFFPISVGDRVQFESIGESEFHDRLGEQVPPADAPSIEQVSSA